MQKGNISNIKLLPLPPTTHNNHCPLPSSINTYLGDLCPGLMGLFLVASVSCGQGILQSISDYSGLNGQL